MLLIAKCVDALRAPYAYDIDRTLFRKAYD